MRPMFLSEVEESAPGGAYAPVINELREAGLPVPQIMHLFAYKPDRNDSLSRFTQGVMRGPSPLPSPSARSSISTTNGSTPREWGI
ncbi:MAG: peroxidase [Desulfobacteria bacterium]